MLITSLLMCWLFMDISQLLIWAIYLGMLCYTGYYKQFWDMVETGIRKNPGTFYSV